VMNVSIAREIERLERRLLVLATLVPQGLSSACSAPSGHHVELPVDRGLKEYLAGGGRPGIAEALLPPQSALSPPFGDYFLQ